MHLVFPILALTSILPHTSPVFGLLYQRDSALLAYIDVRKARFLDATFMTARTSIKHRECTLFSANSPTPHD
jgi:hypothetical protein